MARTLKEVQLRLNSKPSTSPKLDPDGDKGEKTTAAVVAYQKSEGLKETGIVDADTLARLFPEDGRQSSPHTIQATIQDWVLNFAASKINQVAVAAVALAVGWISTKFGFNVPADVQQWVTSGIIVLGGSVIVFLRGMGKDVPRVANKTPAVIEKPTEYVGQQK